MKNRQRWYSKIDKPRNYYRSGLTAKSFQVAMEGRGWVSLTQVCGELSECIAPEAKARYGQMDETTSTAMSLERRIATGFRGMIGNKLRKLAVEGKVQKDGKGKDAKYRWIVPSEVDPVGQDSA